MIAINYFIKKVSTNIAFQNPFLQINSFEAIFSVNWPLLWRTRLQVYSIQNRDPYCPRRSWSAKKKKKKKKKHKKAISRIKMCCTSYKMITATFNISTQTRNKDSLCCYPM